MVYNEKLREERLRRRWTQKEVADLINVPDSHTIGRWERGINVPSSHYCRELCRIFEKTLEELDLNEYALKSPDEENPSSEIFNKLPANFTSFVGRRKEVDALCALLQNDAVRLLVLLGSGGIGKTRLSIEAAVQMHDYFTDGICYVSLAVLRDPAFVLPTIATALGIQENVSYSLEQQVKAFLRAKRVLLLLDNFEHIASAAPVIEELLLDCPYIKVLVTSRHVLQLGAEHTFTVPPLSLPDLTSLPSAEELMQYAAIALFVQRVQTYHSAFKITDDNASAIAELCVRLDGLPLAIELAAARIKLFSPQALLARFLQDQHILRSELLSIPERHRTLYYTIQWSYDLLNEQEQWLFRHLSVFVGGSSLETIEAFLTDTIPSSSSTIMEIVVSLLNKSLLQRIEQDHGEPRFVMLETLRTYALNCLQKKGELEEHRHAYALHYLALVEQAAPFLKKAQQAIWLAKMDRELDNLRNALQWFIERKETDLALRFAEAFGKICGLRGYWHEEQRLLNAALQLPSTQEQEIRGKVLRRAGHLAYRLRDLAQARTLLEQSVACSRKVGDWQNLVGALSSLGWVLYRQNELDAASELLKECVAVSSYAGDYWVRANALESQGRYLQYQGKQEEAYALLQESVAIARAHLDKESLARILTTLVHLEVSRGKKEQAMQLAQESFQLARELNTRPLIALTLGMLGTVALFQGDYAHAQQYFEDRSLIATELGDLPTIAHIKLELADIALVANDFIQTEHLLEEALGLLQQLYDTSDIIMAQSIRGDLKYREGDSVQAKALYQEALRHANASADKRKTGRCLFGLVQVFLAQEMAERATYLLGAAAACLKPYDMYPEQNANFQQTKERLHTLLGEADFVRIWEEGNSATREQILSTL
jgi:predicted ATPase/transcriptional regulator with XRE-family HTH domain